MIGTLASADNSGLQLKCNKFTGDINYTDIGITSGSMALNQGSCGTITSPAGNTFNTKGTFGNLFANTI